MKAECETKCKLLDTAMQLIWENSYGSVSVDDICVRAGARKGSFYYFFPSKADLAVAAFERNWEESKPRWDHAFSAQLDPLERFRVFAQLTYEKQVAKKEKCGKVCGCPYASAGSELSTQDEKIRLQVQRMNERCIRYFESALVDAERAGLVPIGDQHAVAAQLYALVAGMILQAKISNDPEVLKGLGAALLRLMGADVKTASTVPA